MFEGLEIAPANGLAIPGRIYSGDTGGAQFIAPVPY
jgi:hypothetical protein